MSGCSRALLSLGSTAILFQALFVEPVAWFLMRLLTGYCFAGAFIVAESWLNGAATNETRGQPALALHGGADGRDGRRPVPAQPRRPQGLRSVHPGVGADLGRRRADAADRGGGPDGQLAPRTSACVSLYRLSPLGVVGIAGVGIANSGLFSMGPVYATQEGLSVAAISTFMAAVIMGGVVFQMPVGRLSDRLDRRWVIAAVAMLTALVVLPPALLPHLPPLTLFPGFFLVGGLSLPLYAICVAHTNDFLSPEQMVGASSALILAFGIGAAAGPTLTALTMQLVGPSGFPLSSRRRPRCHRVCSRSGA